MEEGLGKRTNKLYFLKKFTPFVAILMHFFRGNMDKPSGRSL